MGIAQALVDGRPDRAAMAREAAVLGLAVEFEAAEDDDVEVYPDHVQSLDVFCAMGTQMTVAMSGVVGYRYEALPVVFDLYAVPSDARRQVFDDFRALEGEVLRLMRERRDGNG